MSGSQNQSRFYIIFIIMFLTLSLIAYFCYQVKPGLIHVPGIYISQSFFLVIIPLGHWIASKGLKDRARDFHMYYMGSMGIRFLLSVVLLFLMVLFFRKAAWPIVINFFLLYFLYTSFEIYSLLANLRAENKKE